MDWFSRVPTGYRPAIEAAYAALPARVTDLSRPRFLCGVSPVFVGLHGHSETGDGRSYHDTAHACFERHTPDRISTVVLPGNESLYTVIHELGHIFDEATHFTLDVPATTSYSETDRYERVAEAFALLFCPDYFARGAWLDYLSAERFRPFREIAWV